MYPGSSPGRGTNHSELPERPIGASWKDDGRESGTRVRISHSLPRKVNLVGLDTVSKTVGLYKG